MSSPAPQASSHHSAAAPDAKVAGGVSRPSRVRITVVVQHQCTFDTEVVTGRQIKETANVPPGFVLYRRVRGGNQPIPDDTEVEVHTGDHFFARPSSSAS